MNWRSNRLNDRRKTHSLFRRATWERQACSLTRSGSARSRCLFTGERSENYHHDNGQISQSIFSFTRNTWASASCASAVLQLVLKAALRFGSSAEEIRENLILVGDFLFRSAFRCPTLWDSWRLLKTTLWKEPDDDRPSRLSLQCTDFPSFAADAFSESQIRGGDHSPKIRRRDFSEELSLKTALCDTQPANNCQNGRTNWKIQFVPFLRGPKT